MHTHTHPVTCMSVFHLLSTWYVLRSWKLVLGSNIPVNEIWDSNSFQEMNGKCMSPFSSPTSSSQKFHVYSRVLFTFWLVFVLRAWASPCISLTLSLKEWNVHCLDTIALFWKLLAFYCFTIDNLLLLCEVSVPSRSVSLPSFQTTRGSILLLIPEVHRSRGVNPSSHSLPL